MNRTKRLEDLREHLDALNMDLVVLQHEIEKTEAEIDLLEAQELNTEYEKDRI